MAEQLIPPRMDLMARLEERARVVARRLGHDLGPLLPGRAGEQVAVCARCGALAIITPYWGIGVRGTACSMACRTRRRLRLLPGTGGRERNAPD